MFLLVSEPPTVSAAKPAYRPIRGRTITLACNIINGTRMWWKRFNGRNEINVDINKSSGQKSSSLTIRNIQAVDDGDYKCYGENKFGRHSDTVKVSSVGTLRNVEVNIIVHVSVILFILIKLPILLPKLIKLI